MVVFIARDALSMVQEEDIEARKSGKVDCEHKLNGAGSIFDQFS